ncbi:MAG: NfeD family protein [Burkholderiales bacterium]|nr:NfeD family protein [Burkholderiales bacterium]
MPLWLWWAIALALVGAELMTGTFYLLAIAVAFLAGGIVAWAGGALTIQLAIAGVVGVAGSALAYYYQQKTQLNNQASTMMLDVGKKVIVVQWNADKTARVEYSGTQWDAVLASPETPCHTEMKIAEVRGSTLVLTALD